MKPVQLMVLFWAGLWLDWTGLELIWLASVCAWHFQSEQNVE